MAGASASPIQSLKPWMNSAPKREIRTFTGEPNCWRMQECESDEAACA